jgi:predicted MFS family arabinose efflux permease
MVTVALLSLAFLCGVSVGIVLGMILVWRMTKPAVDEEPDYSEGV